MPSIQAISANKPVSADLSNMQNGIGYTRADVSLRVRP